MKTFFGFLDTVWLFLVIFRPVSSTSAGAPPQACIEMTPWHNGVAPNTTPCPFKLTANVPCFQPGQRVILLLQDPLGQQFKGLMVQARLNAQPQSVGKFDLNDNKDLKFLNCFGSASDTITHSNPIPKQFKEFGWTAPDVFPGGSVDFTYTVVQSYTNFWAKNVFNLPFCASGVDFTKLPNTSDNPISQTSSANDQPLTSSYTNNDETVGPVMTTDVAKEDTATSYNIPPEVSSAPSMTNGTAGTESVPSDSSAPSLYDESFPSTITMTATESNDVTTTSGSFNNTDQDFLSPFTNSSVSEAVTNQVLTTTEIVENISDTIDPNQTNQDFSGTVTSSVLETVESNQSSSTITDDGQTDQYSSQFPNTDSSSSEAVTTLTLQTMESEQTDSTAEVPQTGQQFSEVTATLPSVINDTPTPGLSSILSQIVSTTTTSLQVGPCVDSGPECKTLNMNKCYNHIIKTRCCLSCTKLQSSNSEGCEYGDKISICGFYRQPKFCQYYKDECCATCRDVV